MGSLPGATFTLSFATLVLEWRCGHHTPCMAGQQQQQRKTKPAARGLLARPLDALVFLLPLIAFYEIASLYYPERVIAFDALQHFFELFGHVGVLAPGLAVVAILTATHAASRQPWRVHWRHVGLMYVEAAVLAIPLLLFNRFLPLAGGQGDEIIARMALGVGAGVYEELLFRLAFISLTIMLGTDVLRLPRDGVAIAAVLLSSLAFAAHHHYPIGAEPFDSTRFLFRSLAGVYLAGIFWFRGYGPAAGCHAAYNVALVVISAGDP